MSLAVEEAANVSVPSRVTVAPPILPAPTPTNLATLPTPDLCPVTRVPFLDKKTRWSRNEEIRLLCVLLGAHEITRGQSLLAFLYGARDRQDLDRSTDEVEQLVARVFNDPAAAWPQFEHLRVFRQFDPCKELRIPRRAADLMSHFRKDIVDQLKSFTCCFQQSGKGSLLEWDFERHPAAEFLYRIDVDLIPMCTGTILDARIPETVDDAISDISASYGDHSIASDTQQAHSRQPGRTSPSYSTGQASKRRRTKDDPVTTALEQLVDNQTSMTAALTEMTGMFKAFLEQRK